ncbi:MAG: hypothetical protein AAF772_14890, partial [Acidobacteriota bacterium]
MLFAVPSPAPSTASPSGADRAGRRSTAAVLLITAIAALLLSALGALAWWWLRPQPESWTTDSSQAVKAFEQGFEALGRGQGDTALAAFERAIALDPDFLIAQMIHTLITDTYAPRREEFEARLTTADLTRLRPIERGMLASVRAFLNNDPSTADAEMEVLLAEHPDDPIVLWLACQGSRRLQAYERAEVLCARLLEQRPSWVEAHETLGLVALAQGQFDEAESRFVTYRFIAPDEVTPYLRLAEIQRLRGQIDDALYVLDQAAAIAESDDDRCAVDVERMLTATLMADAARAFAAREVMRANDACRFVPAREPISCYVDFLEAFMNAELLEARDRLDACDPAVRGRLLGYKFTLVSGDQASADAVQAMFDEELAKIDTLQPWQRGLLTGLRASMEGLLLAAPPDADPGRLTLAADAFANADQHLLFWSGTTSDAKQVMRLEHIRVLERLGRNAEAQEIAAQVDALHPDLRARYAGLMVDQLRAEWLALEASGCSASTCAAISCASALRPRRSSTR